MKPPSRCIFLTFITTCVTFASLIGATEVDPPPQVCAYDTHTCEGGDCWCADLERDLAICGKSDGGWKFGINAEGTYGLWKPNGKLLRLLGRNQDWFWMEVDDSTWMEASPYEDDDEDAWSIGNFWCEHYKGGPMLIVGGGARKEPGVDDDVIFRYGADPPYEQIMTINRKGEIRVDPKCYFNGIFSAPPKNCKYVRKMKDSDEELVRDEAICGRKGTNETEPPSDESYDPHEYYTGWRFGINSAGTLGLWKPNGDLVKAYASYQDSFVVGENFIKSMSEDDEGDTKTGLSIMCEAGNGDEASGMKLIIKPGRDPLIQLEPRGSSDEIGLMSIDRLGNIEIDEMSCELHQIELVW